MRTGCFRARYFGQLNGVSKSVQVLLDGIEAVMQVLLDGIEAVMALTLMFRKRRALFFGFEAGGFLMFQLSGFYIVGYIGPDVIPW